MFSGIKILLFPEQFSEFYVKAVYHKVIAVLYVSLAYILQCLRSRARVLVYFETDQIYQILRIIIKYLYW